MASNSPDSLKYKPVKFVDTTFQNYAEKISTDYTDIIKARVLPQLDDLGDLKLRELRVLTSIHFFAIPITPAHISDILRYDPATVSRAIKRLEAAGKLIRQDNGRDKRSIQLKLTLAGKALAEDYTHIVETVFDNLESDLLYGLSDEEKTAFLNIVIKISRRAEAMKALANL